VVLAAGMEPATKVDPVVNLAYRQGPAFRDIGLFDGYCDSNFICFPYETQRTGIYAAGAIRRAMTIRRVHGRCRRGCLKAIQCLESTNRGVSVHPRSGDMTFPDFFFQRCTQCKRCTEECPFGALDDDEKGTPKPNPSRCRRCGTCMGACPERIIGLPTTASTASVPWSRPSRCRLKTITMNRRCGFWAWSAKTMPIRHWTWPG
jgi:quinone-modifying oxidoreductase subunit QmoB